MLKKTFKWKFFTPVTKPDLQSMALCGTMWASSIANSIFTN